MNLFWGYALIIAGLSIVINIIFGINLPIIKIFVAGFLIYLGITILLPSKYGYTSYFNSFEPDQTTVSEDKEKYSISFGSSIIDLDYLTTLNTPQTITIDVQFANAVVLLPKHLPLRVKANVLFATVHLPGRKTSSEYVNLHGASESLLTIYINSNFASVIVKE